MMRLAIALLALALATPAAANTPAGLLREWLAAFNSGERARIDAFYGAHLDDPDPLAARHLRAETCGFDLIRIERTDDRSIGALLAERCIPALRRVSFTLGEDGAAMEEFSLRSFAVSGERADAALVDVVDRMALADDFAGTIVIERAGEAAVVLERGAFAPGNPRPITRDTPMFLASAGKMFTAVAILQLVEQGRVELDAPLSRYLPDYPNAEMAEATIRQLLSHRAGAGDDGILTREDTENRARVRTIDDLIALNGKRPPAFAPGSKMEYSNYGFILLGAVIERVGGQPYPDYIAEHVFAPVGMTGAGFPDLTQLGDIPTGRTRWLGDTEPLQSNIEALPWRGSAAGGGVASANDMLRFFAALRGGKLLPPHLLELATTPGESGWYGLGFVAQGSPHPLWGHGGFSYGMNVAAQTMPEDGVTFVCLATRDYACDRAINAWFWRRYGLTE